MCGRPLTIRQRQFCGRACNQQSYRDGFTPTLYVGPPWVDPANGNAVSLNGNAEG